MSESLPASAGVSSSQWVPYAEIEAVACPRCKAAIGAPCVKPDGSFVRPSADRGMGETRGGHLARGDRWYRMEKARIAAVLRAEDVEDADRRARGLPRNWAILTDEQASVINAAVKP